MSELSILKAMKKDLELMLKREENRYIFYFHSLLTDRPKNSGI